MLARRRLVIGGCCTICGVGSLERGGLADTARPFICSTIDSSQIPGQDFSVASAVDDTTALQISKSSTDFGFTPYGTSLFRDRWLLEDGRTPDTGRITLGVYLIDASDIQRRVTMAAASAWTSTKVGKRIDFDFDVARESSDIRIQFAQGSGNRSYVGRNCRSIAKSDWTMTIEDLVDYVVRHEFGHTLGLQHEHQFPHNEIQWNKPAVIAALGAQGWKAEDVKRFVFDKMGEDAVCTKDPGFNVKSIMLYPIPPEWTLNGFSSSTNTEISAGDIKCLSGLYNL
jgi:serralysin